MDGEEDGEDENGVQVGKRIIALNDRQVMLGEPWLG